MFDYIKGQIIELTPTELILENQGIGYSILISLQTYEAFQLKTQAVAYIHHYIREDEELFYGFATKDERELFRLLIGVSGIGVASARMMLSTLTSEEIRQAILSENVNKIKSVKGIGLKSAQRLVLELKDKIVKGEGTDSNTVLFKADNSAVVDEATNALVMLGFTKANISKVMPAILKENPNAKVEDIIKAALKRL
ncbi:MAG: Holliday junction branch migration protein RuvA [Bacteroidales bacterium]|nr:Holliday junction branch migration protein RuvA [Bacteroidales bacterium]